MPDCNGNNPPPRWSLEELALAYELRQEGCSWKRIAQGLGRDLGDDRLLSAAVSHLVQHGIRKGRDGYARQPGRPATFTLDLLRAADRHRLHQSDRDLLRAADPGQRQQTCEQTLALHDRPSAYERHAHYLTVHA